MLIELVDDLRCPRPHEETWLVASADRTEGREIVEGTLGCPICHAEYPIRRGVVWFAPLEAGTGPTTPSRPPSGDATELAMRLAAFLDLTEAQGFALLSGSFASCAEPLRDLTPAHLVLLNPRPLAEVSAGVSVLQVPGSIPLAAATCRGVALDEAHADPVYLTAAVRVLRLRGRLVAPASAHAPAGVTELARDEHLWVAERNAAPPKLIPLRGRGASI